MRRIMATLVGVGVLALALTGCEEPPTQIELGIKCHEAGGEWVRYSDGWGSGQYCRFAKDEAPE